MSLRNAARCLLALLVASSFASAEDTEVRRIRERARAFLPTEEDLALFRLDWADSVDEAMRRSKGEGRPIFLVVNYADAGDLKNGHC